ncbi:hypothetical protein [Rhizobium wenxiniae]|uniref:hypothetical protein n=1 Tax=Rhizobium wenxiniae TaxID=1737357 RepID=UPI003C1E1BA1
MSTNRTRMVFLTALGGMIFASSMQSAYAFSVPVAAESKLEQEQRAVSAYAYAGGGQQAEAWEGSSLSAHEVKHIQWCAARYKLDYDAVNDVYTGANGSRLRCHSPR